MGILLILIIILLLLPRKEVTFNSMGGTEVKTKRVLKNRKLTEPGNPRMHRKVFIGWYKDPACTIPWQFDKDKVKDDITLYAKWL